MEHFAELFNKLQGVLNVVGGNIDFPQIVVVGSQVGTSFLLVFEDVECIVCVHNFVVVFSSLNSVVLPFCWLFWDGGAEHARQIYSP